ncbi:hypothetical protein [Winogradskyella sediminis]|uniref:YD repeat-containing protein n=1 Tax=Winogradskyella sediminis TaxID=1382466 RepID=A0A1H1LXL6_9FLAO|nr:hypothetical protein [Winogradskyella sediminis]SDR79344.1 hypothetical protein SAMN04489797_0138 [Winogradskyella sediminis]
MKNQKSLIILLSLSIFTLSCSEDSVTDEFDNANGNVQEKLIESISIISAQDSQENKNISLSYTSGGLLNTISDGVETSIFVYDDNDNLSNITGGGNDNLNIEELYESPYDAFETGEVIQYDDNGNPKEIEFYEEEYDYNTDSYYTKIYTAEISYDNTHNPYFYTLEAGGIIEVLDDVQLNFSLNPQIPEIVQARLLFPVNNPSQLIYKNEEGEIIHTINVNYSYDNENYPTSATVTAVSVQDSEQSTYSAIYQYVD